MRILIVDDEASIRKTTSLAFSDMGHAVETAESADGALAAARETNFDVVFLDLKLDRDDGLDLIAPLLDINPHLQVVVITAFSSIESAVEAIKRGAADYVPKPFTPEHLRQVMAKLERTRRLESRVVELEALLELETPEMVFSSVEPAMNEVLDLAARAAPTPATLLILGESGTGKSVLARAIHRRGERKDRPFVTVNCPSLSRELLESDLFGHVRGAFTGAVNDARGKVTLAEGGTLFLDEVGDLPGEIQSKLLRLLQDREYERVGDPRTRSADIRVIAATNRDLGREVTEGRFREDLFYRLSVFPLELPPLRRRPDDLPVLARKQLEFLSRQMRKPVKGFAPEAERLMRAYDWPGNLRELRNAVERALILARSERIQAGDLPAWAGSSGASAIEIGASVPLEAVEREHIKHVVDRAPSLESAAEVLGIDPATLYRKRKRFGLK